jgi:hypothetical protein
MAIENDPINFNQTPSKVILALAKKSVALEKYGGSKKHTEITVDEIDTVRVIMAIMAYLDYLYNQRLL